MVSGLVTTSSMIFFIFFLLLSVTSTTMLVTDLRAFTFYIVERRSYGKLLRSTM